MAEFSGQIAMKRSRDIFAKCITWQEFAAGIQSTRRGDAAKGKCNCCGCVSYLLANDETDRMVATPQTKLLDLPPELLMMIVDATEKSSLANMRLTCRKLQDVTNEAFGTAFFTTRYVIASESSIDTLLEIVRHLVFGRYVNEIEIASDFLYGLHGRFNPEYLHAFSSTVPRAFKNIQRNHGSVDLVFYEHPNSVCELSAGGNLEEVFYIVTRVVEQSQCTLGQVWLPAPDRREACSEETMRMFAEADGWKRSYRLFR